MARIKRFESSGSFKLVAWIGQKPLGTLEYVNPK